MRGRRYQIADIRYQEAESAARLRSRRFFWVEKFSPLRAQSAQRKKSRDWAGGCGDVAVKDSSGAKDVRPRMTTGSVGAGRKGKVDRRLALFAGSGGGALGFWGFGFGIFGDAELVGGVESTGEDVFGGGSETDVGHAHAAPTTGDGKKHFGEIGDESLLLFEGEHEIAVALLGGSKGGEDAAVDAEIGLAHMGGFFGTGETEGDAAEITDVHGENDTASVIRELSIAIGGRAEGKRDSSLRGLRSE